MTFENQIYLDYNSTTPCAPEVVADMLPYFTQAYGNPSSLHSAGRIAFDAISRARTEVASAIGADKTGVIFTSGATESNNLAFFGFANKASKRRKIVVSAVEHKSILAPASALAEEGYMIATLPVNNNGVVDLNKAHQIIDDETLLVAIQAANNETGVIQPVSDISQIAHSKGAICHCDAAQAIGKMSVDVGRLGVDTASFSAHKVYGPKGVGALYVSSTLRSPPLRPILWGGSQENELRAGTQNVPAIVGFGCACRLADQLLQKDMQHVSHLRMTFEDDLLRRLPYSRVNARDVLRLPGTISLTIPGIPADMLMANLPNLCLADGSACNSGALQPSHVLLAMNLDRSDADCTVRISLGRYTSESDIKSAAELMSVAAQNLLAQIDGPN